MEKLPERLESSIKTESVFFSMEFEKYNDFVGSASMYMYIKSEIPLTHTVITESLKL